MKVSRILAYMMGFTVLFLAACGGDEQTNSEPRPGYYFGVKCPRLELEHFNDCLYESADSNESDIDLNNKTEIAHFCQSSCNKIEYVMGYNDGTSANDLSILKGIKSIKSMELQGMQDLQSLDGLEALEEIERDLKLIWNPKLKNMEALLSLKKVSRIFKIQGNKKLKTLHGLENFREGYSVTIFSNNELEDITALNNLEILEGFGVDDNPKLPTCQAENIRDMHGLEPPDSVIANNGTGSCD